MPKILLTPDVLREKATELTQCQEDQQQVIRDVQGLIDDIVSDWEGEAQQKFRAAFERRKVDYDKFAPDMSRFADFLKNYSETMEYLDIAGGEDIDRRAN